MQWIFRCLLLVVATLHAGVGASELAEQLRSGSHVVLMRHAYAPGVGDPAGYSLDRCETQRLLNEQGRNQAARIGQWLRAQGVTQAALYSSPWCRCLETAQLLEIGPVSTERSLASFFDQPGQALASTEALQRFIAKSLRTHRARPLVLVTHHVNIREFMGQNIDSGDLVLVHVDPNGRALDYRLLPSL